jgi:ectoine hydroxylase-related dioxygenase (phytanoyl-CoA dioxygenase family)
MTTTDTRTGTDWVRRYHRDGYAVLRGAFDPAEVDAVNAEALRLCRGDHAAAPLTGELPPQRRAAAGDPAPDLTDDELLRRYLCLHFPHKGSEVIAATMRHPALVEALTAVIGPDVKAVQSMLFLKAEGRPGQAWHQDELFIPTRDRSLTAVWVALDDARVDNGCLWVLPGSHRPGVLYPDREHDDPRFDCTVEAHGFPHRDDEAVPVEVDAGDAVVFDGYLLHRSLPNTRVRGLRRALVHHCMSAQSLLPWFHRPGVPIAKTDHRDVVLVAGRDPYAARGLEDVFGVEARAERDGGCRR